MIAVDRSGSSLQLSVSEMVCRVTGLLSQASGYSQCNDQLVFSRWESQRSLTPVQRQASRHSIAGKRRNAAPNVLSPLTEPVADDSE